jgi:hypothetical protein
MLAVIMERSRKDLANIRIVQNCTVQFCKISFKHLSGHERAGAVVLRIDTFVDEVPDWDAELEGNRSALDGDLPRPKIAAQFATRPTSSG